MNAEKLQSGPLHFQHDRFGRPRELWAGDAHIGRFARVEASPYGALRQLGQSRFGPYRLDGAGARVVRRLRLEHPWAEPPWAFSLPL
jgi:hypothetical protein